MKQINNGFSNIYYLTEDGVVYNKKTDKYIKYDMKHQYRLKQKCGLYKCISLKTLYRKVYNKEFCIDNIQSLDNEVWDPIDGSDGLYYCSNFGRIKSYNGYKAILLKQIITKEGYNRVDIKIDGLRTSKLVHRLVAASFLPIPERSDYQLHHINTIKTDNRVDNLIWLSPAEHNLIHKGKETNKRNG